MRILLVEDEVSLRKVIKMNLEMEGYEVVAVGDGLEAVDIIDRQYFDLLLLDIMLPGMNGLDICEKVRLQNDQVGIIFISAKDTSEERIHGLRNGADDYLTKPFSLDELLLRVSSLLKRTVDKSSLTNISEKYVVNDWNVDFTKYVATRKDEEIHLTKKEVLLLKLLIDRKNQVVSRQQILQTVWGYDIYPSTRTIDNFILNFRKYFEDDPKNPRIFNSIRSVGYKFSETI